MVLAEAAEITQLGTYSLAPGHLPGLWVGPTVTVKQVYDVDQILIKVSDRLKLR